MCIDDPAQLYLFRSDELVLEVTMKQDLNETLKQYLKKFDKRVTLYSMTLTYYQNEYGDNTVKPIV